MTRARRTEAGVRRALFLLLFLPLAPTLVAFDLIRSPSGAVQDGNAKMKAGKADEALAAYDKAVAELPAEPGVHFDRGTALAALSRFDEAGEEFLRATEARDPALKASAFYNLGNAFTKKDKFKEAIEAYKRALALDPKNEGAKWNLEIALKKKRDDDKKKEEKDKQDKDKDKKNKDEQDKDKQDKKNKDEQDKDKQDKKNKDEQDKDKQDKKNKDEQDKDKDKKNEPPPPSEKSPAEREIESVLDNLEKSPKDLEKQRAMMRAVRRAPPTRDW